MDVQALFRDPREFRRHLLVDTDAGVKPFAAVMDDWQRRDFESLDNGWRKVVGAQPDSACPSFSRGYLERGRGHSKTTDIAVSVLWALAASKRKLSGVVAAADTDQAGLLPAAVDKILRLNSWLGKFIEVQRARILNSHTGSELTILSSDVGSSYGLTPDFIVCDELTHWPRRELWDSLFSSAAKRERCLLLVISNAGTISSWQWETREAVRADAGWYFSRLEGPRASWITGARLGEQRRLLPRKAYERLWLNCWVADTGDAIADSDLEEATSFIDPVEEFDPQFGPYIGSLDIGVRRDHSAFNVFGLNLRGPRVRVAKVTSWNPQHFGGRVPLQIVRQACGEAARRYGLLGIAYDPSQGEYLAEKLTVEDGVPMYRFPWTSKSKEQMALQLVQSFRDREVDLYQHEGLLRDLRKISIVERGGRYSLVLPSDEFGHCDIGASFCQGLVFAIATRRDLLGQDDAADQITSMFQPISN